MKINYHDLLEKVLYNIAWENGFSTVNDAISLFAQKSYTSEERRVLEHLLKNLKDKDEIT